MDERQRFEAGMQVRRAVLGEAHVERARLIAMLSMMNFKI